MTFLAMTDTIQEPLRFQTSRSFQFLYLLPILLAAALAVDLVLNGRSSNWPLIGGAIVLALVTVPRALARVDLQGDLLSLTMPLRAPKQVALDQLVGFERSGRMGRSLILRYHPMNEQGMADIASEQFLGLPPLEMQADLEAQLEQFITP
ncbi:MAG: hypothetical protein KDG58_09700 [Anaerolineae bacterium]|nr:hypothetical protein [Anaerolineae bacterium]